MLFAKKRDVKPQIADPNYHEICAHIGDYLEIFHQFFTSVRYRMYVIKPAETETGTAVFPVTVDENTTVSEETKCYYSDGRVNEYHNVSFHYSDSSRDFFINMDIKAVHAFLKDLVCSYYLTVGAGGTAPDNVTTRISASVENSDISSVEFEYSIYDMKWHVISSVEYRLGEARKKKRRRMTVVWILYSILFTGVFFAFAYIAYWERISVAVTLLLFVLLDVLAIVIFYFIMRREQNRKPRGTGGAGRF